MYFKVCTVCIAAYIHLRVHVVVHVVSLPDIILQHLEGLIVPPGHPGHLCAHKHIIVHADGWRFIAQYSCIHLILKHLYIHTYCVHTYILVRVSIKAAEQIQRHLLDLKNCT